MGGPGFAGDRVVDHQFDRVRPRRRPRRHGQLERLAIGLVCGPLAGRELRARRPLVGRLRPDGSIRPDQPDRRGKIGGCAGELPYQCRIEHFAAGDLAGERSHAHGQVGPERGGQPIGLRGRALSRHEALHAEVRFAGEHLVVGKLPTLCQPAAHLARWVVYGVVDAVLPDALEPVIQRCDLLTRRCPPAWRRSRSGDRPSRGRGRRPRAPSSP